MVVMVIVVIVVVAPRAVLEPPVSPLVDPMSLPPGMINGRRPRRTKFSFNTLFRVVACSVKSSIFFFAAVGMPLATTAPIATEDVAAALRLNGASLEADFAHGTSRSLWVGGTWG